MLVVNFLIAVSTNYNQERYKHKKIFYICWFQISYYSRRRRLFPADVSVFIPEDVMFLVVL